MKDFLGNELEVGDEVIYIEAPTRTSSHLCKGTVVGFKGDFCIIEIQVDEKSRWKKDVTNKSDYKIYKIMK